MVAVCVFHYQWPPVQSTPEKDGHSPENRATGQSIIPSSLKSPSLNTYAHTYLLKHSPLPLKRPHTHWWDVRVLTPDWICPLTPQDPKKGRHPCRCHGNTVVAGRDSWTMMPVMSSTQWEEHPTSFPIITSCLFPLAFNAIPIALTPTVFKKIIINTTFILCSPLRVKSPQAPCDIFVAIFHCTVL